MAETLYFLGQRLLATSQQSPAWSDTDPTSPSLAYICPTCGDLWGRVQVPGQEWLPVKTPCKLHSRDHDNPGSSFIFPWKKGVADLPPEVLNYEILLRLDLGTAS